MSEPRHVLKPALSSFLGAVMVVGVAPGIGDANAEGRSSALSSIAAHSAIYAQSESVAEKSEQIETTNSEQTDGAEGDVPFSELNEALSAARSRLAELTKAAEIAKVAGELREELEATRAENKQLKSTLNLVRSENTELETARQAASRQADKLDKTATEAAAEATRLDEELVAMRWQNSQLSTSLARAEATAQNASEEFKKNRSELTSRQEALASAAEQSGAKIVGLQRELDATKESLSIAMQRGTGLDKQVAQLRVETENDTVESTKLARDLDQTIAALGNARAELIATQEALDEAKISLASTNQESAILREQVATNRQEADRLRQQLKTAEIEIERVGANNGDLVQQIKILRAAAGEATNAARLNLIAVEDQIDEINAALATAKGDELVAALEEPGELETDRDNAGVRKEDSSDAAPTKTARADETWVPTPTPARATIGQQLIAAAAPAVVSPQLVNNPPAASSPLAKRVIQTINKVGSSVDAGKTAVASLVAGLPADRRGRAEALLAQLNVRRGNRGLTMTVPGTILFAVNSETIEPSAYDTLASVAEIVDLYGDRDVLVVGHTDAVGNDDYNQKLSERRADLVKSYFIDQFKIGSSRLTVEGEGEKRPITSNATVEGRDANRRVEVIILD